MPIKVHCRSPKKAEEKKKKIGIFLAFFAIIATVVASITLMVASGYDIANWSARNKFSKLEKSPIRGRELIP